MITTDKDSCYLLANILKSQGVEKAVLCPGARDLPLITAFVRQPGIETVSIVDEREASFSALGMAEISGKPVAVVCTSGSAILNMAPAAAEAFYKHIPLILISADRPEAWIDQEDSQTIRQYGVLKNIVKKSYSLPGDSNDVDAGWETERIINEAAIICNSHPFGPVHINVPLDLPLNRMLDRGEDKIRTIKSVAPSAGMTKEFATEIAQVLQSTGKVLIASGSYAPDSRLSKYLVKLSSLPNVYVLDENLSNLHIKKLCASPDALITALNDEVSEQLVPQILITFGGSIVSSAFKNWIRNHSKAIEHWHISSDESVVDTFKCLSKKFVLQPTVFFGEITACLRKKWEVTYSNYKAQWANVESQLLKKEAEFFKESRDWCDLAALKQIVESLSKECNIQVSNGLSVRYLMLLPCSYKFHRVDCNRGVSGIDGSTSTAMGASMVYSGTTVLISGDMSARYDLNALLDIPHLTENFKIVVMANGGGNIFKFIKSAEGSDERENYLVSMNQPDWKAIAENHCWRFYEAADYRQLSEVMDSWIERSKEPAMLVVKTNGEINAEYYHKFLKIKI